MNYLIFFFCRAQGSAARCARSISFLLLGLMWVGAFEVRGQTRHVVLISIDGLRPEMYQDGRWPTPNLQRMMKEGVWAEHLKSVFPAYTYPSHTAMLTGALPARSGIYFNQPKGSKGEWNWFADSVRVSTLWKVCKAAGLVTAAVEWPVSVTRDITYNVPEIWDVRHPDDRITAARGYATKGLVDELELNATGRLDSNSMRDGSLLLDENAGRMAAYIFVRYKPALLAVHFANVDGTEHEFGREHDSVRLAVAASDRGIGDVLEAIERSGLKDSTAVIVVGDHGFSDIHEVFRPNRLIRDLPARFIAAGGSAFLYLRPDAGEPVAEIVADVKKRLGSVPAEKRELFRVIDRTELDRMGADSTAVLALAAKPGLVFSGSMGAAATVNNGPGTLIQQNSMDGLFVPVTGGHHGYDPNEPEMYTGFIAAGTGIKKGGQIEFLSEPDIAPLIAKLLGIDLVCPDGKLVPGIIGK